MSEEKYRKAYDRINFYKDLFAHDINNIFQNILSSVDLISMNLDNPAKIETLKEYLTIIKDQINRGARLVSNVRKISEIDEIDIKLFSTEVIEILKEVKEYILKSFHNKNISIQIESEFKLFYVKANEFLSDVFENLLINAISYNDKESVIILIKASKRVIDNKGFLRLEFSDNGMGIPNELKVKIFQKKETQKRTKGLGLGLTLVKKVIQLYQGEIWVENRIKGDYTQGSNFIILLPEAGGGLS